MSILLNFILVFIVPCILGLIVAVRICVVVAKRENKPYGVSNHPGVWVLASIDEPPEGKELDVFYLGVHYKSWYVKGGGVYLREFDTKTVKDLSKIKWFKHSN